MSNTNNNLQTQTSNVHHNAIMEAGGKDRPPMLALGNYVQWKSRIKRYINTKLNNELIHYSLQNPPYKFKWTEKTVPVAECGILNNSLDRNKYPLTQEMLSRMLSRRLEVDQESEMAFELLSGSRDRPPMLATGRYAQWRSRFLRYIDTDQDEDSLAVPEQTTVETAMNMTPKNRAHFESEKEAIHLILTGIGDEIYSTVDACQTAQEMWEAIERLQQGESLNIQDVKTNLFWEFGQFTSHDGETIESYYTRFYKMMNEIIRNNLDLQDKAGITLMLIED
ncbi:hypothetical protein Tco_0544857 [Tanacetum coccineum]